MRMQSAQPERSPHEVWVDVESYATLRPRILLAVMLPAHLQPPSMGLTLLLAGASTDEHVEHANANRANQRGDDDDVLDGKVERRSNGGRTAPAATVADIP